MRPFSFPSLPSLPPLASLPLSPFSLSIFPPYAYSFALFSQWQFSLPSPPGVSPFLFSLPVWFDLVLKIKNLLMARHVLKLIARGLVTDKTRVIRFTL